MNEYLTFDDVLMRPNYCGFESRKDVSTKTVLVPGRLELEIPILSSPMDTITGPEMCVKMNELGGMGILHRFCSIEENVKMFNRAHEIQFQLNANHGVLNIGVSVGVNEGLDRATALWKAGARIFCVDTAHAHSKLAGRMVHSLRTEFGDEIIIIGGSVCTYAGSDYLVSKGADIIRVGIGPGGFCLTRTQTGFGLPQFSTLQECAKCSKPIIADGGIKQPGDVVKALGIGSACVMLGSMLAGTLETPGEVIYENRNGTRLPEEIKQRPMPPLPIETNVATYYPFKAARGMASRSVVEEMYGEMPDWKTYEGISTMVPAKGSASEVIQNIIGGLRSGLTYAGAKDLEELRRRVDFVKITPAGRIESGAHILGK